MHRVGGHFLSALVEVFEPLGSVDSLCATSFKLREQRFHCPLQPRDAPKPARLRVAKEILDYLFKRSGGWNQTSTRLIDSEGEQALRIGTFFCGRALVAPLTIDSILDLPIRGTRALEYAAPRSFESQPLELSKVRGDATSVLAGRMMISLLLDPAKALFAKVPYSKYDAALSCLAHRGCVVMGILIQIQA
jgi:hypothetical protein